LKQDTCADPVAEADNIAGLAIVKATVFAEQFLESLTVITYEPEVSPEKEFELWKAPPFKLYEYAPVPPVAETLINPSLRL
jgi:hypothetical protein